MMPKYWIAIVMAGLLGMAGCEREREKERQRERDESIRTTPSETPAEPRDTGRMEDRDTGRTQDMEQPGAIQPAPDSPGTTGEPGAMDHQGMREPSSDLPETTPDEPSSAVPPEGDQSDREPSDAEAFGAAT